MRQPLLLECNMKDITPLLDESSSHHDHLCPRQILGVRIGLTGLNALDLEADPSEKQLLVIIESDGCFADGVIAATGCTVGHRRLRVEDYGKVAATFVDIKTGNAVRVAPVIGIRQRACAHFPKEPRHYFAQMQAYQTMQDDEFLTVTEVQLTTPVDQIISRPGMRVECASCGEEVMNEREIIIDGEPFCTACAQGGYYRPVHDMAAVATEGLRKKLPVMG